MTSLKILLVPFSIAFLVLFGIFWIYPEYKVAQDKDKTIAESEAVLEKSQVMFRNGEKLSQNIRDNAEKKDLVLRVFPRQGTEEDAVWLVSQLAQNSGVTLTDVSVEQVKDTAPPVSTTQTMGSAMTGADASAGSGVSVQADTLAVKYNSIKFSSVGSYETFQKFLVALKSIPRVLREDDIKIEVKREEKTGAIFQMSGTVTFAYAPLKRVGAGVISPVFKEASFDFGPLEKMRQDFGSYPDQQEIPYGRPNPFLP